MTGSLAHRRRRAVLAALAGLAGGCTPVPRIPPETLEGAPRTWDEVDLVAGRSPAYVPADSASPLPWGRYPTPEEDWAAAVPGFVHAAAHWRVAADLEEQIRVAGLPSEIFRGIPRVGRTMTLRAAFWPAPAYVVGRGADSATIATPWESAGSFPGEVRCEGATARGAIRVRLTAQIIATPRGALIRQSLESQGAARCWGNEILSDRLRGFVVDVAMALRTVARSAVPVPIRPTREEP